MNYYKTHGFKTEIDAGYVLDFHESAIPDGLNIGASKNAPPSVTYSVMGFSDLEAIANCYLGSVLYALDQDLPFYKAERTNAKNRRRKDKRPQNG
ncbi:MAG: hypothetical protein PHE27_07950 [Alphaproteobacteria bacterium]|nr:hypothetical protein [Alphaproteobacteria bacterium]